MLIARIVALVALALTPALLIQGYNEYALRTAREAAVRADALRAAHATADDIAGLGESLRPVLDLLAQDAALQAKDPAACTTRLRAASGRLPGVILLALTEPDGRVICNSRGSAPGAYTNAERSYHRRAVETGALAAGEYAEGTTTHRPSLHVAEPMRDGAGAVAGVLVAAVDLAWLSERPSRSGLAPDTALSVIDARGRVLARVPDHALWVGRQIEPERVGVIEANVGTARDTIAWDGQRRIVAIARPNGPLHDLTVSVGRDRAALFADIDAATRRGVILILLGAALAFAAAVLGGRAFVRRPVQRLLAAAAAWRRGDLSARAGVRGGSEFGRLGEAFDAMAGALERHEGDLRAEIARSRTLQEQQSTMLHELNHRVKNTLATVQALARQFRGGEAGGAQLEGRILALSKTHDLLTRDDWTGATLREVFENELGPYRNSAEHFALAGADVALPPRYVLALGMTVHELTTNAAKYGALSRPEGRVGVRWRLVTGEGGTRRLSIDWRERGGPPVGEPERRGFGTRLITGSVQRELAGEVRLSYEPAGLRCVIDVPYEAPHEAGEGAGAAEGDGEGVVGAPARS